MLSPDSRCKISPKSPSRTSSTKSKTSISKHLSNEYSSRSHCLLLIRHLPNSRTKSSTSHKEDKFPTKKMATSNSSLSSLKSIATKNITTPLTPFSANSPLPKKLPSCWTKIILCCRIYPYAPLHSLKEIRLFYDHVVRKNFILNLSINPIVLSSLSRRQIYWITRSRVYKSSTSNSTILPNV